MYKEKLGMLCNKYSSDFTSGKQKLVLKKEKRFVMFIYLFIDYILLEILYF